MFIQKLKSTGLVVALTALGLASATTALLAFQDRAEKGETAAVGRAVQDSTRGDARVKKAYGKASGRPNTDRLAQPNKDADDEAAAVEVGKMRAQLELKEGDDEAAAVKVGKMRAQLELLELTCETTRNRIRQGVQLVDQLEDSRDDEFPNSTPEDREKARATISDRRNKMRQNVDSWQELYLRKRIEIAQLKHRIARAPKSLVESGEPDESLAEVVRRIDRLEAKVDRIADSIGKGQDR